MVYAHQIVDIIVSLQQTLFFVGRNFEKFLLSCGCQGDGLPFQIDTDGGRRADRTTWNSFARNDSLTCTGSNPLFRALLRKISAKKLEMTTLKPAP